MEYWLVKQEPEEFSWADFVKAGRAAWTGVRNYQARNHLRAMKKGDLVLFYHSGTAKEVVGVCRVDKESYPDPTASEGDWSAVDLVPVAPCQTPVSLAAIKGHKILKTMALLRQSRWSVVAVTRSHFQRVLELANTRV